MYWRDLLNVQNVEKGFFDSSNSYGIPDVRRLCKLFIAIIMNFCYTNNGGKKLWNVRIAKVQR